MTNDEYERQRRVQIVTCCYECKDCMQMQHDGYECRVLKTYINEGAVHYTFLKGCPLPMAKDVEL